MPIKILATGDLHIGQKVSGLPETAEVFSARDTWKRIVEWSIGNEVDVIALTGDIIDRENRFFEAIGSLQSGFTRLKEKGIMIYMISGNHDFDVLPQIIQSGNFENVKLLGAGGKWQFIRHEKGNEAVQFAGWSFPRQYVNQDPSESFDLNDMDPDVPSVGLLHCEVTTQGSNYAPLNIANLMNKKIDTWILGHIHKPDVFSKMAPFICYPGSPLAFSSKENGLHGPVIMTVRNGQISVPEPVLFSPVRFETMEIDITGCETIDQFTGTINTAITEAENIPEEELIEIAYLVFDLTLSGTHGNITQLETWSAGLVLEFEYVTKYNVKILVRRVNLNIQPAITNLNELAQQETPAGILAQTILAVRENCETEFIRDFLSDWKTRYKKLNKADIYLPLEKQTESEDILESAGRNYILKESTRLLSELLQQKKQ